MKPYQKADGGVLSSVREYDIAAATKINRGQVVKIADGLVVAAVAAETGRILGVAAENHSGVADALNPRENGTKILVWDAPDAIFACPVPTFTATGGFATTVTAALSAFTGSNAFKGGYLKLISKGAGSTNTDPIGTIKRITAYAYSSSTSTFTVESGATACSGDVYALFPQIGFVGGNLDIDASNNPLGQKIVLTATANLPIKVIGRNEETDEIYVMANLHALGVEE